MAYFHCRTPCFRFRLWSPDWNVCNRDRDLSLGQGSVPKMGTVPIWQRDLNLNLSQWKHVLHILWQFVLTRSLQSENAGSSSTLSSSSHPHSAFVFAPAHCLGVPVSCQMKTDIWYFELTFCLWCWLLWILTCDILNLFLSVGSYGYWPVIFWTCF